MSIQRYEIYGVWGGGAEHGKAPDGDYVLYSDHIQVVHENGQEAAALMLESVRGSLREWPTAGCDIEVAKAVVAIRDAATAELEAKLRDTACSIMTYTNFAVGSAISQSVERRTAARKGE